MSIEGSGGTPHSLPCLVLPGFLEMPVTRSVTLTFVRHAELFSHEKCLPLTTLCVDDDKGTIKAISFSLTEVSVTFQQANS